MSDRITGAMVTNSTVGDLNSALSKLERSSDELSSGKSILEPSDNPYGASRAIDLQSQLDGLETYTKGIQDGISWTNTAESAMQNMSELVQRARELTLQASNGTYSAGDLSSLATQIEGLTETIKQDANTQYGGQYVFSGTLTTTQPYQSGETDTYAGNAEAIARSIGPGATVAINTNISSLLGNGKAAADGKLLDVLRTIAQHMHEDTTESKAALSSSDLKNLDANFETLTNLQAASGGTVDQLHMAATRIESLQSATTAALSNTQDADLAQTSIAYSSEQAAYTAALHAGATIIQESLLNFLH